MKRIFLIFRLIFRIKIIFKEPKNYKLVIFDDESIDELKNVIQEFNYFIMQNRISHLNKVYVSYKLVKLFIKNYKGNIMTAYLVSLLEIIKPKAVITFIDNSEKFSDVAKLLDKKIKFVAIQNAWRDELIMNNYLFKNKFTKINLNKYFYIPNFLCFGQYDVDNFRKHKMKVKKFIKVGSLRLANAIHYIKKNKVELNKSRYDVCFISDASPEEGHFKEIKKRDGSSAEEDIAKGFAYTARYAIKFCMKHNKKLIFALKRKKNAQVLRKRELDFYKKNLTKSEFNFLIANSTDNKINTFPSYLAMFESPVIISSWSTMLLESLAVGKKIFACNLTNLNLFDFPITGICSIKNCDYEEFEKKLMYILSMSNKKYFLKLKKDKNYMTSYNKQISTIEILKNNIKQITQ